MLSTQRPRHAARAGIVILAGLLAWQADQAQAQEVTFSTNFLGGTPGSQPSDASLNGLEDFTQFGGPNSASELFASTPNIGEVLFVQVGPYYVGGNRAYGFAGEGRSDITFTPGVVRGVELQVRGSSSSDTSGPNSFTIPGSTPFQDSDVTVLIWSELGLELTVDNVSNDAFQTIALDITNPAFDGDSITRVSLINEGPDNSIVDLGLLTVTAVPEPSSLALLGLGAAVMLRRRRSH
ncbi:MAG: PEP-CTERM sorting domain-containing protein [Planctomycetota bacterium]